MNKKISVIIVSCLAGIFSGCIKETTEKENFTKEEAKSEAKDTANVAPKEQVKKETSNKVDTSFTGLADSSFVEVNPLTEYFAFDMKYATKDNFLKEKVYDCPTCLLRVNVVKALLKASSEFNSKGYRIKFFDCYRPLYIQKKMWQIMPDSRYVANPKSGSIHNRGAAVDITLVDKEGKELDMGTKFDHFGEEAHHSYTNLSKEVLENRMVLKSIMEKAGFKPQPTEWWHYNFITPTAYPVSNTPIVCD